MRVELTSAASRDLDNLLSHTAKDNPLAAIDVVTEILSSIELLTAQPEMGRPSAVPGVRELIVLNTFVVPYRVIGDLVEVLRVWHGWRAGGRGGARLRSYGPDLLRRGPSRRHCRRGRCDQGVVLSFPVVAAASTTPPSGPTGARAPDRAPRLH